MAKTIPLVDGNTYKAAAVLKEVLTAAPTGVNLDQMRKRIRCLDALDKLAPGATNFTLEDADYMVLAEALQTNQWGLVNAEILAVVDGVLGAAGA